MEPNDVNPDQALEAALHRSQPAPLADDGFTAAVMQRLPARRKAKLGRFDFNQAVLWTAAAAALLIIARQSSLNAQLEPVFRSLNASLADAWRPLGLATALLACIYGVFGYGDEKSRD